MFDFSKILPQVANNELDSPKIAIWAFILFTALMTWRSIVHMLFESWGLHGIANFIVLTGDPDPMPVIYRFFSLWGASQVLFCLVCWVVVFKYCINIQYKLNQNNIFLYQLMCKIIYTLYL